MENNSDILFQWQSVCEQMQQKLGDKIAVRWLNKLEPAGVQDNQLCLLAPSPCVQELIKKNYADSILSLYRSQNPAVTGVKFSVKKVACHAKKTMAPVVSVAPVQPEPVQMPMRVVEQKVMDSDGTMISSFLDPAHTFDSFVVGKSNEFAYAAAKQLAEEENFSFSPLYLHSAVGLGKTHLMHAMAWRIQELYPNKTVLYLSSEQFFQHFIKSMRSNNTQQFRNLFRSVDVLMIDDVQFIFGKKATQEEFFHTFNSLIAKGKKIILSADSAPADLDGIEERIKTRIMQGLVVDIHPTSYELRLGILQEKAAKLSTNIPGDVLDYLAKHITSNVRELEGALNRIVAHAELMNKTVTLDSVKVLLKDILRIREKSVSVPDIQQAVAEFYKLTVADLKSARRERRIARPRQLAMYLAKQMTTLSLPDIAAQFDRDHTTIIHAVRLMEDLVSADHQLGHEMQLIMSGLKESADE